MASATHFVEICWSINFVSGVGSGVDYKISRRLLIYIGIFGGGLRIRTLGGDKPSTVFKTAAFDHSASPPEIFFSTIQCLRKKRTGLYIDENGTQGAQATCVLVALKSFRT